MTDPNGWPDASKPGVPLNPERDGWHWLSNNGADPQPWIWCGNPQWFWLGNRSLRISQEKGWTYIGPCLTPQEVAAREAAAEARGMERAARLANEHEQAARESIQEGKGDVAIGGAYAANEIAAAIRAAAAEIKP